MNMKKVVMLAAVLAALAGLYALSERSAANKERRQEVALAAGFEKAKAAAVAVRAPKKQPVVLKKGPEGWQVSSGGTTYAADNASVDSLLGQIGKMKSATVVSKNPKNFDSFEVSDATGVEVKIDDAGGAALAHVIIGKNGPDIFSSYVRPAGGQAVYLVPGFLKNSADRDLKDWREKKIFSFRADTVKLLTVRGDRDLQIKNAGGGKYQAICKGPIIEPDPQKASQVMARFAGLAAADFSDNTTVGKPVRTIRASMADGSSRTLLVGGDKNGFQQFVKTEDSPQVYVVEKSALDSLTPSCDELKAPPAADNATAVKE